ncbi:S-adenosyl-L-methionine-dependent methyltransferase [Cadophora sp. MPI-SDFR-AT-0126]|nr:S-adenosyl-L-methionine-dependent methyltransferase [Leotiomycetes sp. MPI-SDFR-AT-0126]
MAYQQQGIRGDDPAVTKLYGDRTVATSCQYFVSHVAKGANILDVGCGPGVITSDLAKIASEGKTIGLDNSAGIIEEAAAAFPSSAVPNLSFTVGDATKLSEYADNTFDVVHSHQVLVHLPNAVTAIKEYYRVCKPGGIIAFRDSSPAIVLSLKPDLPGIRAYWDRAMITMQKMGSNTKAGNKLEEWATEAGLGKDGGKLVYSKSPMRSPGHTHRTVGQPAEMAIQYGMASREEMDDWHKAWVEWEETEGSEFVLECGEILCWKGK